MEATFLPIPGDDKINYCLDIILKEAKKEKLLVSQLFYSLLSMYTQNPVNLAINAPSGEGKNYIIHKVVDLFPKEDVLLLSGMTEKSLFHRSGKRVIKNELGEYEFIDDKIERLEEDIAAKEDEAYDTKDTSLKHALKKQIRELHKEKKELYKDAMNLIDLSHKTLVFLDTPPQQLFDTLMSMLSHDQYESEYEFVDTNNGIKTRRNVLRGWPVVVFAQATDYSWYKRYPEIQRRFIITNPKMDREKYAAAIELLADKYGMPNFLYQAKIVSDTEKDQAREIIRAVKEKISDASNSVMPGYTNGSIPFIEALMAQLPKERTSDITFVNRLLTYMSLVTVTNIENRPYIWMRKEGSPTSQTIPLSIFEDLKEALYLVRNTSNVRPYILDWYHDVFLTTYNKETIPKSKTDSKKNEIFESRRAVTTKQLSDATYELTRRKVSPKTIKEAYINQLVNEGYIDEEKSELNKSHYIYYPIMETTEEVVSKGSVFDASTLKSDEIKIVVENPAVFPSKDYIYSKIDGLVRASVEKGFKLAEKNLSSSEIVEKFYNNPEKYFELRENTSENTGDTSTSGSDETNSRNQEKGSTQNDTPDDTPQNSKNPNELDNSNTENENLPKSVTYTYNISVDSPKSEVFDTLLTYSCSYCGFKAEVQHDYDKHIVMKHPGRPGYANDKPPLRPILPYSEFEETSSPTQYRSDRYPSD